MADDVTISFRLPGAKEAKALVDAVTAAMRQLATTQASAAAEAKKAGDIAAKNAKTLSDAARLSKEAAQAEQDRLVRIKATNAERLRQARLDVEAAKSRLAAVQATATAEINAVKATRKEAVEAAKVYAAATKAAAAFFQQQAQNRLAEAEAFRRPVKVGNLTVLERDQELINARKRELREQNENVARAAALGESQIRLAKRVGQAEIEKANKTVAAQKAVVKGAQQSATATQAAATKVVSQQNAVIRTAQRAATVQQQIATQAQRNAQQQVAAANRVTTAYQRQYQGSQTLLRGLDSLRRTVRNLIFAYSGFRAIESFIKAGIRFNQTIETSKLGIAALITAEAQLEDQQGNLLTGTNALRAAQSLAGDQLTKLRIAGIQTAATTQDLVQAFQEAVGAGVSVGLTLDQIRTFTVSVAQAATAINLPFSQLNQEVRSILQGTIDRNSRIAKALQLTNAEVNLAKQQGRLADLLNEKFKAFNIAGAESVKTFGALKSNISDAFQVFAGDATQPLFEQLRIAGLKALSEVFDFKSAEIQASFRGLIEGGRVVFREVGLALADALEAGVGGARKISEFLSKNKEEVKATAAAVGTLVREFGALAGAVADVIGGVSRIGQGTNTVISAARVLTALLETIKEQIFAIIALLSARVLITQIGKLVALISLVRAGGTGATAGSVFGPLGTAIGALIGLAVAGGTAFKLFGKDQKTAALEAARTTTVLQDQKAKLGELVTSYQEIQRALDDKNITQEETQVLEARLQDLYKQFKENGGQAYVDIIKNQSLALEDKQKILLSLMRTEAEHAFTAAAENKNLLLDLIAARNTIREEIRKGPAEGTLPGVAAEQLANARAELEKLDAEIEIATAKQRTLQEQADRTGKSLEKALTSPSKIRPVKDPQTDADINKDIDDVLQRARGEFERMKAAIDVSRENVEATFAKGLITTEQRTKALALLAIAEIDAEEQVLKAQIERAEKRQLRVKGKGLVVVPDQGAIDEALLKIKGLEFRREQIGINTDKELTESQRAEAARRAKIQEDFLRATGRRFEAARLQIQREHDEQLRQAIRDFGAGSEEVVKIRVTIDREAIEKEIQLIEDEIQRAEEQRNREVEAIRARFSALGKLSDQEKQDQLDQITDANQRAVAATDALMIRLTELRDLFKDDPAMLAIIDLLIARLDTLKAKTTEVNVEMRKLTEGARDAVESGLAEFLENIGNKATNAADLFKAMVKSIIDDLRRLVSEILAKRILNTILSAFAGASGGGNAGNLTQSEGRAAGGPGRPRHGRLQGGIRGLDTIPILAQEDEWFLRPAVRRKYGDAFLAALNNLELPAIPYRRYKPMAEGGVAGDNAVRGTITREISENRVRVGLDRDGMLRFLASEDGQQIILSAVKRNPSAINATLRTRA